MAGSLTRIRLSRQLNKRSWRLKTPGELEEKLTENHFLLLNRLIRLFKIRPGFAMALLLRQTSLLPFGLNILIFISNS
ncbi:hypothetical protein Desac_2592 [Desulfobacca acetoxidans DSM 11109]|uniref:Uncharacterized protein n=1 Tax=Desulfobacca acetoxidans (strain ATCC 700848 / DSM 11109 / ASRB2) TaxID=880072 RepID=F2NDR2_DESAR|nr:hypothetical protein Desac_2592 [Desulfobacca acetoxidans DSM 11109]